MSGLLAPLNTKVPAETRTQRSEKHKNDKAYVLTYVVARSRSVLKRSLLPCAFTLYHVSLEGIPTSSLQGIQSVCLLDHRVKYNHVENGDVSILRD